MAKALICDICGKTYPFTGQATATGHWERATKMLSPSSGYRLVYAVFKMRNEMEVAAERGGEYMDVCANCAAEILSESFENKPDPESEE